MLVNFNNFEIKKMTHIKNFYSQNNNFMKIPNTRIFTTVEEISSWIESLKNEKTSSSYYYIKNKISKIIIFNSMIFKIIICNNFTPII